MSGGRRDAGRGARVTETGEEPSPPSPRAAGPLQETESEVPGVLGHPFPPEVPGRLALSPCVPPSLAKPGGHPLPRLGEARTVSSGVSRASSNGRWCFLCPCTQLPGVVRPAGLGAEGPGALHSPGHGVQQAPWTGGGSRGRMRPQAALPLPTVTCVSLGTPGRPALPDRRPRGPWSRLRLVSCTRLSCAAVVSWTTSP